MSEKIKSQDLRANPATGQLTSVSANLLQPSVKLQSSVIAAVVLCVAAGIFWSSQARIVEVASGLGRVIPATRNQLVQNLEGGIVKEILVREGTMVKKGTPLLRIDPSTSGFFAR
ncbi:MAG: biotin/lipoyl-binding protein [Nitratireductor sp.]